MIQTFDYQGSNISFEFSDGNKMINANQMAKPFGKRVSNFLRLKETKEYISLLESRYSHVSNGEKRHKREVVRVVQGGTPELQGTWIDEKLALKFAAWLSAGFELWVYDRIEELLKTGRTELQITPSQNIIRSIRLIADQLEAHDQDIKLLKEDVSQMKDYMGELDAKITSIDENYYSVSGYCALYAMDCPLDKAQKWGYNATKLSHQLKRKIGKAYNSQYGNVNTYHIDILKKIIK